MFTRTDKPLLNIVFTLETSSVEHTENVSVYCEVLYRQKRGTEPVANDAVVEFAVLQSMPGSYVQSLAVST